MIPAYHAIAGAIIAIVSYPFLGLNGALIAAAVTVVIDFDHYPIYVYRTRNYSFKKAYKYFREIADARDVYPLFHMVEVFAICAFLSAYYPVLFPFVLGQFAHIVQDWFEDIFLRTTKRNFFGIEQILIYVKRICERLKIA